MGADPIPQESGPNVDRRVIVYTSCLLPRSQTFIKEQALALRGWDPVLVGDSLAADGIPLDGLNVSLLLPERSPGWRQFVLHAFRYLGVPDPRVTARLYKIGGRLIHAHFGTCAVDIWPYARSLGLPLLVTLHGYDINIDRAWWESGRGGIGRRSYPARLLKLAQQSSVRFLAVSEAIRRRAIEFGISENKVVRSYVGVDVKKFCASTVPIDRRRHSVLFVGRLVEKKGLRYLIEAFRQVACALPTADLVIVGDGPLRRDLEDQARALALPNVAFRGALTPAQVCVEMGLARVLCLPSITASNGDAEGFGLVLLEAQASGLPVVTSARGGAKEGMQDGVTGFMVSEGDSLAMGKALLKVLSNDSLWCAMSTAAAAYVRNNFDLHACSSELAHHYESMISPP